MNIFSFSQSNSQKKKRMPPFKSFVLFIFINSSCCFFKLRTISHAGDRFDPVKRWNLPVSQVTNCREWEKGKSFLYVRTRVIIIYFLCDYHVWQKNVSFYFNFVSHLPQGKKGAKKRVFSPSFHPFNLFAYSTAVGILSMSTKIAFQTNEWESYVRKYVCTCNGVCHRLWYICSFSRNGADNRNLRINYHHSGPNGKFEARNLNPYNDFVDQNWMKSFFLAYFILYPWLSQCGKRCSFSIVLDEYFFYFALTE